MRKYLVEIGGEMRIVLCILSFLLIFASVYGTVVTIGPNKEILVDGKPFFPIMQWAQSRSRMAEQRSCGFNTYFGQGDNSTALEYANEARKHGLMVIVAFKEDEVSFVKEHPALLGWYYRDEPDMPDKTGKGPRIPIKESISVYEKLKSLDKNHPMFLTLTTNYSKSIEGSKYDDVSFYKEYKKATDIIGFDIYPIYGNMKPECLWWVATGVTDLRKIVDDKLPIYAWIETNAGSKWITPSRMRHPYPYEIRAEVWMAIIRGAKAIGYFTHSWVEPSEIGNPNSKLKRGQSKYYTQFGVPPENQKELGKINTQITKLTPIICSADVIGKVKEEESGGGDVEILVKEYEGKLYIFAVNMKRGETNVKFKVEGLKKGTKIEVDEEKRDIVAEEGMFEDNFKEHAVHIYIISR